MRIQIQGRLEEKFRSVGRDDLIGTIEIDNAEFIKYYREAIILHPNYDKARKIDWAIYCILSRTKRKVPEAPRRRSIRELLKSILGS